MTKTEIRQYALDLPLEERMELAAELWASIEAAPRQPALPEWQRDLLDHRIAEDDANPYDVTPWQEVKRQILAGL